LNTRTSISSVLQATIGLDSASKLPVLTRVPSGSRNGKHDSVLRHLQLFSLLFLAHCSGQKCNKSLTAGELRIEVKIQDQLATKCDGKWVSSVLFFCPNSVCFCHPKNHACPRKMPSFNSTSKIIVDPTTSLSTSEKQFLATHELQLVYVNQQLVEHL
jgi:hypothetical protein